MDTADPSSDALNDQESELYDRQIRLWGVQAQKRMSSSKVLYAGFTGVCAEAAKNLVLAGIHSTIQDHRAATYADLGTNFFLTAEDVGKNRAASCQARLQQLNNLAKVDAEERSLEELEDAYFKQFTCICLSGAPLHQQKRIDGICRSAGVFLYVVESFGFYGYLMLDLGQGFSYRKELGENKGLSDPIPVAFPSIEEAVGAPWPTLKNRWGPVSKVYALAQLMLEFEEKHGRRPGASDGDTMTSVAQQCLKRNGMPSDFVASDEIAMLCAQAQVEINPVCAVLGGILGQEVIKALSQKGTPAHNVFLFDGTTSEGKVMLTPPAAK